MNVAQCLNSSDTLRYLECKSEDGIISKCECNMKNDQKTEFLFNINNTDLYSNLNVNEVSNINITDTWYEGRPERMNDCFKYNETSYWICTTYSSAMNETYCRCLSSTNVSIDALGNVKTKSLYKGLEDIKFPIYVEPKILTPVSHDNYDRSVNIIRDDINHYTHVNFNGIILLLLIFSIICSLGLLSWYYKDTILEKCRQKHDDIEPLLFITELEEII